MKTERSKIYNAREDHEQLLLDVEETKDFYLRALSLLIYAGYDGEYATQEVGRYMRHERNWPEGTRDYRLMFENFVGLAIADKMRIED